jgi:uncharacterized protein YjiS (DUF1127 family)
MELVMSSIALTRSRPVLGRSRLVAGTQHLVAVLQLALQVRRERRALLALDDAALKDVGFNRLDAHAEAQRSFWDVPADRLRG